MKKITFPIPTGFNLPEGDAAPSFEALATLEIEGDNLVLVAIDGIPLGGEGDEKTETSEKDETYADATNPDTGDFQKAVSMGMGPQQ
jgi:hypothetical protein